MDKKTLKILGIVAGIVAVAVIGYLIWMYGLMDPSEHSYLYRTFL